MPAHIRATYLVDPCYYSSGTICANCGEVPDSQCTWVETGENLAAYMKRLKSAKSQEYHLARFLIPIGCGMLLALVCAINAISDGRPVELGQAFGSVIGGALLAFYPSKFIRLAMCKFGWI